MALNLHGIARSTEDLDLFVDPEAENVARLRGALASVFHDPREVEGIALEVATPRMLYGMKKDTVRLQDRADAERLRVQFGLGDD